VSRSPGPMATLTQAQNAIAIIELACTTSDPAKRAQLLAEAQPQLGWALRSAIEECEAAGLSWADVGQRVGLPRETVYRQYQAGGPVVTVRAAQTKSSPNLVGRTASGVEAIFAFQDEDGRWWGSPDVLPVGEFSTAALLFQPANPDSNRYAGQVLRVRFGQLEQDVSFASAQVQLGDGTPRRVRVTYEIVNLLLEDGQTPLRRALTQAIHAAVGNPQVDGTFQDLAWRAAHAQAQSTSATPVEERIPAAEFVAAVKEMLAEADRNPSGLDEHARLAVRRLERVVEDYDAWRQVDR
jgi:hypothetical protein